MLGFDPEAGDHVWYRNGEVVIDGPLVERVGAAGTASGRVATVDDEIDLGDAVVMPGLIDLDALGDIDHALLDTWAPPELASGQEWSAAYAKAGAADVLSADERRLMRRYALTQLVLHGVTTAMPIAAETHSSWAETFDESVALAEEAASLGLRVYVGPSYRAGVNTVAADGTTDVHWDLPRGERGFDDALRFLDWARARRMTDGSDLVQGALLPCRIETVTDDLLRRTAAAAEQHGVPVRLHMLQSLREIEHLHRADRGTPVDTLERVGLLRAGTLVPHAIYLDDHPLVIEARRAGAAAASASPVGDLERLATAGVAVVHCPLTSLRYGTALRSFGRYVDAGVRMTLGTDSFPPDLIRGIDVGSSVARLIDGRADAAPVADYLRAATLGAADVLGRHDLGRLTAGATADLVAFSLDDLRDGAIDDPLRTLVASGTARQTVLSIIAGRVVVRGGRVPGLDECELRSTGQRLFMKLRAAYGHRDHHGRSADVLFPAAFASG